MKLYESNKKLNNINAGVLYSSMFENFQNIYKNFLYKNGFTNDIKFNRYSNWIKGENNNKEELRLHIEFLNKSDVTPVIQNFVIQYKDVQKTIKAVNTSMVELLDIISDHIKNPKSNNEKRGYLAILKKITAKHGLRLVYTKQKASEKVSIEFNNPIDYRLPSSTILLLLTPTFIKYINTNFINRGYELNKIQLEYGWFRLVYKESDRDKNKRLKSTITKTKNFLDKQPYLNVIKEDVFKAIFEGRN